ncbi:MAG TPA: hypothetical protein VH880_01985, partial [Anaeromyxobacteraceae bacterium]
MKTLRALGALAPLALAACGGVSPDAFEAAAPSYEALAIDVDAAASQSGMGGSMMPLTADSAVPAADFCHPHLFMRTEGLAARLNRHLWKFLRLAEEVTARKADLVTGTRAVWERTRGTFDVRFTVTRQTDVLYDWLLEVKPTSEATWTTVFSGWIDRTGATGKHQGKGH